MIVSIHQPNFLPWLGFFHKMHQSDVFVLLDNAQYTKHLFQNRTKIKTAQGERWLTVPVITRGYFGQAINEVQIDNKFNWQKKHLHTFQTNYTPAPFFKKYYHWLEDLHRKDWKKLSELSIKIIKDLVSLIGINTKIIKASSLNAAGTGTEALLNICKKLNANIYLSGPSGRNYLDEKSFKQQKIDITYHQFKHPVYKQQFGKFLPNLSIVDLLFNHDKDALSILIEQIFKKAKTERALNPADK